jgi:hypothetical protein
MRSDCLLLPGYYPRRLEGPPRRKWIAEFLRNLVNLLSGWPGSNRRHPAPKWDQAPPQAVSDGSQRSQTSDFVRSATEPQSQPLPAVAPVRQNFAAPLLHGRRGLRMVHGGRDGLLITVRDVAAALGVCTATVYRLCADG